ncbi:hypothetical protein J4208_05785 [Candidatus Woesearchaeota archaeon]|nr:hypothetical protein [Candidatus Woesearchaeota archaeon]
MKTAMQVVGLYGVVATGKSTLAHHVLGDLKEADLVVTDNLLAIKRMQDSNPIWEHSSYSQWERFGNPSKESLWKGFLEYRAGMDDFMACILRRARDQKVDMIFEGIHIAPMLFDQHKKDLSISLFLLSIKDPEVHKARIREKCMYRPSLLIRLEEYFSRIRDLQDLLIEEAQSQKVHIIDTSGSIDDVHRAIRERLV